MTKISTKTIWCDECKLKVFDCEHLQGKNAAPDVPDDVPLAPGKHGLVFLAFEGTLHGLMVSIIKAEPQILVKPMRLVVDPRVADDFMLMDIKTGVCSQFAANSGGGASCAVFPPTPPKHQPVNNLAGLPAVAPGQSICLLVRNRSPAAREFNALMWCATPVG